MSDRARTLAYKLLGTCDGAVDQIEELTLEECRALDDIVLNCVACNWWVEAGECDEDGVCSECRDDG